MEISSSRLHVFVLALALALALVPFSSAEASADESRKNFLQCLNRHSHNSASLAKVTYTPNNSSFTSVLQYTLNNLRYDTPQTRKPLVVVTPVDESQIQVVIYCCKKFGLQVRTRSGGHDFEGRSYVASAPFVLLDLINHRSINIDTKSATAWVQGGASLGELYYAIGQKSKTLAFPAGLWANVGVGGIISGGGYGMLRRKYGLSADNVLDARLMDVNGRILDRNSMGEDLFWAIRGGGGSSFGVILAWKLRLVPVPEITTVFRVNRTLEQNALDLFHRWQYVATKFPRELDIRIYIWSIESDSSPREDKRTILLIFESLFLGTIDKLLPLLEERFPELGVVKEDCTELSWAETAPFFSQYPLGTPLEILLNRTSLPRTSFKGKSDFAKRPISKEGLLGIWEKLYEIPALAATMQHTPWGGRMDEIPEATLPFPHRAGNLFMVQRGVFFDGDDIAKRLKWTRDLEKYIGPYFSPRASYVNYNDLDLGIDKLHGPTSYKRASKWGKRYFKNNFDRLVQVKFAVDPGNFFRHEQSIPPIQYIP